MNLDHKTVDLFCGIGGLSYGLKKAGINVVAGIDLDDSCKYAYETNNAPFINKSISEVASVELEQGVRSLHNCKLCEG